ncbi:hypothetical protein [Altericroceibacterium xinjiangense]|uniref:hypothetical protein n=1 Tax=Altericroceibacterium xinjiangense TaxID=762261 RepID=UPI000F7D82C5|nr:hypothetical protein [Altericroceibacterium xinjiangense]
MGGRRDQVSPRRNDSGRKQAEFAAYAELGEVRCTGCEGGQTNESWFKLMLMDEMRAAGANLHDMMVGWAPGEGATWQGTDVKGSITAQGEIMMGASVANRSACGSSAAPSPQNATPIFAGAGRTSIPEARVGSRSTDRPRRRPATPMCDQSPPGG